MAGNQPRPLTALATRYKHPTGKNHKIIAHTGKSGLTPVDYPPKQTLSVNQLDYIEELVHYQRARCLNFSTQDLVNLEAFAPYYNAWSIEGREDGGIDLKRLKSVPIHPLYAKYKWEQMKFHHIGKIPLGRGRPGEFEGQNPLVWEVLDPCLRLATVILSNSSNSGWWDALLNGEYEFVERGIPDRFKGKKLLRFRPANGPPRTEEEIQKDLMNLSNKIGLEIFSGLTEPETGLPKPKGFTWGATLRRAGEVRMGIALELLEPMMNGGLSPAEVKLEIFRVTITLLHETAHAVWMVISDQHPDVNVEPYFYGHPISELGFSMEAAIFGGRGHALTETPLLPLYYGQEIPCGAIYSIPSQYFQVVNYNKGDSPFVLPLPRHWDYVDHFPIPVGYFEDLFRPEFRYHARKNGAEATRMGPRTIASRLLATEMDLPFTWSKAFEKPEPANIMIDETMTELENTTAGLENLRRDRARRLLAAIGGSQNSAPRGNIDPMDVDSPPPTPTDPNHCEVVGKTFTDLNSIVSEEVYPPLPPCPRYNEIRDYLLANRSQGRLCLDTMDFEIPAFTVLQYIRDFGGINLTREEWIGFLENCYNQHELFDFIENVNDRSTVVWLGGSFPHIQPPRSPPTVPINPMPAYHQRFRDMCLKYDSFKDGAPDLYFTHFVKLVKYKDDHGGAWVTEQVLKDLIDWHQDHGDLWCWGPNWVVRRRDKTWP